MSLNSQIAAGARCPVDLLPEGCREWCLQRSRLVGTGFANAVRLGHAVSCNGERILLSLRMGAIHNPLNLWLGAVSDQAQECHGVGAALLGARQISSRHRTQQWQVYVTYSERISCIGNTGIEQGQ